MNGIRAILEDNPELLEEITNKVMNKLFAEKIALSIED